MPELASTTTATHGVHDLAVIIISTNEASWLKACLPTVYEHAGDISLDVVVVDNECTDDTAAVVADYPARIVPSTNHGFAHGNNRGLMTVSARYVLFLNPDTELFEGTLAEMVRRMDELPSVGMAGCRQYDARGDLSPSMRRFPSWSRQLGEALFSERWPTHPSWAGERILDEGLYAREFDADWTSGSFMFTRMEAIQSGGFLDERFFIYSEEVDFALRIRNSGWRIRHLPQLAIVHHVGKAGWNERGEAQYSYSRLLYARKHFAPAAALMFRFAVVLRYVLRLAVWGWHDAAARRAITRALKIAVGAETEPPYQPAPDTAVRREHRASVELVR